MDALESPAKRIRLTPPIEQSQLDTNADYVAFGLDESDFQSQAPTDAPTGPRSDARTGRRREDPRNRYDRPKSKHALPDTKTWILIKTKLGRRFVHNVGTKESFWRIPKTVEAAVEAYDTAEEKKRNMEWSEEQLKIMRQQQPPAEAQLSTSQMDDRSRRRRSESLQREDEEALMAELAAQAQHAEEQDAKAAVEAVSGLEPRGYLGAASDSEYEYIEVTDTEGEGEDSESQAEEIVEDTADPAKPAEGPVDFGEDDIAYQLAMMGESYGLDPEEYQNGDEQYGEDYDEEADGLALSSEEAVGLFQQMLDEHEISPFTPWDKLIADDTSSSIVFDERYTVLRSSKDRKEAWDQWSRDRAVQLKAQRANEEKKDPRIAYLEFLAANASTKLYWPEFKRKYKREPEMNDRSLQDRDREKYYRELIGKLKLPESKRMEELKDLLKGAAQVVPKSSRPSPLTQKILTNVIFYALPTNARDNILKAAHSDIPT